jgi:hypothetical protein
VVRKEITLCGRHLRQHRKLFIADPKLKERVGRFLRLAPVSGWGPRDPHCRCFVEAAHNGVLCPFRPEPILAFPRRIGRVPHSPLRAGKFVATLTPPRRPAAEKSLSIAVENNHDDKDILDALKRSLRQQES